MTDNTEYRGEYLIELLDADTGQVLARHNLKNQLTEISRTIRTQMLTGTYTGDKKALEIKYFAFGSSSTPASVNDTQLGAETYRKQITQLSQPSAGVVRSVVSLGSAEANGSIKEIGVFCGPTATGSANTGTLLSRVIVDISKNSNMIVNVIRTDTCTI